MSNNLVTLTVPALEELVRRKDQGQCWLNRPPRNNVWGRAFRITFFNTGTDTQEDPEMFVEEIEGAATVRTARVRLSEIFEVIPNVRAILARAAIP